VKLICSVLLRYHRTKNLVAIPDGKRLYAAAGSNSNAAEKGLDKVKALERLLAIRVRHAQKRAGLFIR
jgi:glucose/arabinose dehydrogenase